MSVNEPLIYQKMLLDKHQSKASVKSLITVERAQKLDLLIHLISNLNQPLVVCGPEGIGKSTLLQTLREMKGDVWSICSVTGSAKLSFEEISHQLVRQLDGARSEADLHNCLNALEVAKETAVLIVDDAGALVPGLISALINFASSHAAIRLVFSLTYDELHLKSNSDNNIDESHLIEIPPLTRKQCTVFLQNMSAQRSSGISFDAVTDALVDNLYEKTHGIPGKIIAELPNLSDYQPHVGWKWSGIILVGGLIGGMGWMLYANKPRSVRQEIKVEETLISKAPVTIDIAMPIVDSTPQSGENELEIEQPSGAQSNTKMLQHEEQPLAIEDIESEDQGLQDNSEPLLQDVGSAAPPSTVANEEIDESVKAVEVKLAEVALEVAKAAENNVNSEPSKEHVDGDVWIRAQSPQHYTLQLIVLSRHSAVLEILKKYPHLQDQLHYLAHRRQQKQQFVLYYGSFANRREAEKARKSLPPVFNKAWLRSFRILQRQLAENKTE